ncbi:adenylate/guanylate cyclase domain-containing protein [Oscillatoria sp. CS-180]|uniref:CHASE2 domain-containing protein n=1 Tax=Oscillatoria sp. CS-180 TaxID=3021720 RepID=UPI00233002BE|nr:adenylate/guanylate cyclase domain-containing protein [Oscillatoria sp. CS-180]MDB9525156.1 adenylate/guanylate cyclase domain-containing protein [Oscillatoria sp. CS-180]
MITLKQPEVSSPVPSSFSLRKWLREHWKKATVIIGTSVAVSASTVVLAQSGAIESLEQKVYDQMVRLRHETQPLPKDDRLLVVTVTERDLETLKEFPLSDRTVAQAIDQLQQHAPATVGLDIFRAIPKPPGRTELMRSLQAKNVIVITQISNPRGGPGIPPPAGIDSTQVGFNDVVVDSDGKIRRALLLGEQVTPEGSTTLYSFSLQLALQYLAMQNITPEASPVNPNYMKLGPATLLPLQSGAGGYAIADTRGHQIMLDYRDRTSPSREVTLTQVLNNEVDPAWIKNKIVLIGNTTASSFKDLFYTPFTAGTSDDAHQMPGVIVHAQMVSQLLDLATGDRALIWTSQPWQEWLWCCFWALLGSALAWILRHPLLLTISQTTVLMGILVVGYGFFTTGGWIPLVAPILSVIGSSSVVLAYQAQQSFRQRQMMQELLGQTASPEIAKALWENRDRLLKSGKLPGQKMIATMMFIDIKGFSTLAETTPPEQLLEWLNDYLEAMTEEIQAHHGIVNKFTGDGLLAVFGVPIASQTTEEINTDAQAAVACALCMEKRLVEINRYRQSQRLPILQMRVGIFTGPVVVGSLGGSNRMEYGIIGDSVNIASRLESLNKEEQPSNCRMLIGEDTLQHLESKFKVESWGALHLKGRQASVEVYRILAAKA